jgi:hypothetical protein
VRVPDGPSSNGRREPESAGHPNARAALAVLAVVLLVVILAAVSTFA